jgi:predicted deacylase
MARTAQATPQSPVIAEIDFAKSGKQFGALRVPNSRNDSGWGTIAVPVVVVKNGAGPTIFLTAGNHGDEYEGQVTLLNLARELRPEQVQGRVIIMPAMHFPAAQNGTRMSPLDGRDFNRSFPGDPRGSFAQVLAHYIDSVMLPLADFQMDLHSGGHAADLWPCTVAHELASARMMKKTLAVANAFNAPVTIVLKEVNPGPTLLAHAEQRGVCALSSELGGHGCVNIDNVAITERGVRNVLKHFGVIAGKPTPHPRYGASRVMGVPGFECYTFAPTAGLFQPADQIGKEVKAGETAGWLHFIDDPSRPAVELRYKVSGLLWCTRAAARVQAGDPVAVIAQDR